jgi:hypothetical protein
MSPQVAAAIIAASVSFLTLIGTLAAQYLGRRATGRDTGTTLEEQRKHLDRTLAEQSKQPDRTIAGFPGVVGNSPTANPLLNMGN